MKTLFIAILALANAAGALAADPAPPAGFPLKKGNFWLYRGQVQYLAAANGKTVAKSRSVTFRMEVEDTLAGPGCFAAEVRGFPSDCDWYDSVTPRRLHVIICLPSGSCYDIGPDHALDTWRSLQVGAPPPQDLLDADSLIITLPAQADPDPSPWFRWNTLDQGAFDASGIKGLANRKNLHLFMRNYTCNPETMHLGFVPTIGIVTHSYQHHGTLATCDLHLTAIGHENLPAADP